MLLSQSWEILKNHHFTLSNARQFYSSIGICEITQFHPNTEF